MHLKFSKLEIVFQNDWLFHPLFQNWKILIVEEILEGARFNGSCLLLTYPWLMRVLKEFNVCIRAIYKSGTSKVQSTVVFLSNSSVINTLKVKESLLIKVKNPLRQTVEKIFRRNEISRMTLIYLVFQVFEYSDRYLCGSTTVHSFWQWWIVYIIFCLFTEGF